MKGRPRAILFDLDGTLVDSALGIAAAINRVRADRGGPPIDTDIVRGWVSRGVDILLREMLADLATNANEDRACFRRYLNDQTADRSIIYPGVSEALTRLSEVFVLGVVTNKPEGLAERLLAKLDMRIHFSAVVGGDSAAFPKPHRAPMDLAMKVLGCAPTETVMIGDSEIDALASVEAGCDFILYSGGYGPIPDQENLKRFNCFSELPNIIGDLK